MNQHYSGRATIKDVLQKNMGIEASNRIMKQVNDARSQGKRGDDLHRHFKNALKNEGYESSADNSDILYGFIAPAITT